MVFTIMLYSENGKGLPGYHGQVSIYNFFFSFIIIAKRLANTCLNNQKPKNGN